MRVNGRLEEYFLDPLNFRDDRKAEPDGVRSLGVWSERPRKVEDISFEEVL